MIFHSFVGSMCLSGRRQLGVDWLNAYILHHRRYAAWLSDAGHIPNRIYWHNWIRLERTEDISARVNYAIVLNLPMQTDSELLCVDKLKNCTNFIKHNWICSYLLCLKAAAKQTRRQWSHVALPSSSGETWPRGNKALPTINFNQNKLPAHSKSCLHLHCDPDIVINFTFSLFLRIRKNRSPDEGR